MRGLAYRRRRARLAKKKAKRILRRWSREEPTDREVGIEAGSGLTRCSCPICGNPRKHFGTLTIQERRAPDS